MAQPRYRLILVAVAQRMDGVVRLVRLVTDQININQLYQVVRQPKVLARLPAWLAMAQFHHLNKFTLVVAPQTMATVPQQV